MAAFFDGTMPDEPTLHRLIRKAVRDITFIPVLCGSAFKNKGVQPLLDAVVEYLPSPIDVPAIRGIDVETGEEVLRKPDDAEPFSMLAFKIMDDPFVGTITFARVYSGHIESGTGVLNSTKEKKERIGAHASHARETTGSTSRRRTPATSSRSRASRTRVPATRSATR